MTSRCRLWRDPLSTGLLVSLVLAFGAELAFADIQDFIRSQLLTLDAEVVQVEEQVGEGELVVVAITVRSEQRPDEDLVLLLAPPSALLEAGLAVEVGHLVRARIFPSEAGPYLVHKIWNTTNHGEARLRTLHRVPVWDNEGEWQGSERENCPYNPWNRSSTEDDLSAAAPEDPDTPEGSDDRYDESGQSGSDGEGDPR